MANRVRWSFWLIVLAGGMGPAWGASPAATATLAAYDLASERLSMQEHCYLSETRMYRHGADGTKSPETVIRLFIQVTPILKEGKRVEQATCRLFAVDRPGAAQTTIPKLTGYRYVPQDGLDQRNQVFGIDHGIFLTLHDSHGQRLDSINSYLTYNTFVDFHAFCSMPLTKGVADPSGRVPTLQRVGDEIEHFSSRSAPPVHLGEGIQEGSYYKNGKATARFIGVGVADQRPCALVQWDNDDSSFEMHLAPSPGLRLVSKGHSHVEGTAWIDVADRWVKRMEWSELIVSETVMNGKALASGDIQMRVGRVHALPPKEFERRLAAEGAAQPAPTP